MSVAVARGDPKAPKFWRMPARMKMALEEHERRTRLPENVAIEVAIEEYLAKLDLWPFNVSDKEVRKWMATNVLNKRKDDDE